MVRVHAPEPLSIQWLGAVPTRYRLKRRQILSSFPDTLPACSPVNASRAALRLPAHDSGPDWLATPCLCDSFIRDFTPAYPGALQLRPKHGVLWVNFRDGSQ
jgi:hypothetical protein